MGKLDRSIESLRQKLNFTQRRGILGNNNGTVRDISGGGYYVRIEKSPGNYYPPISMPLSNMATVTPKANIPVYIGYDPIGDRDVITGMVTTALEQIGISPFVTNPADPAAADLIPQERLSVLYSRPHTDSTNKPFYAIVYPSKIISESGILTSWVGGEIDLSSYVPAAGQHRYVGVFIKANFTELEASGSVSQPTSSSLGDSDLNEVLAGGSPGSIPIRAYKITATDSSLSGVFSDSPFLRQFVTTRAHYSIGDTFIAASLYKANSILKADIDNTPVVLVSSEQKVLGRATGDVIKWLDIDSDLSSVSANHDTVPSALAAKTYVDGKISAASNFFFTDTASDVAGYLVASQNPGGVESTVVATITGADQAFEEWATPSGYPAITFLSGIVHFHVHVQKTAGTKTVTFYGELYKCDSIGGSQVLLATSESSPNVSSTAEAIELDWAVPETSLGITDRLLVKVIAMPGGAGTDPELTLYMEGTNNSRISLAIAGGQIDAAQITYTPAVDADWDVVPTTIGPADDELAQRITVLEDAPDPSPIQVNLIPNSSFDVWENGISAAPDGWAVTGASASVARSTTTRIGLYAAALARSGADCHLSRDVYVQLGSTYIRGREYTLGAWVYATVADRARLRVTDGVTTWNSSYHTGDSTWQWLTVTFTPGAAITQLTVGGAVDTGDTTANFDGLTIDEGATLTYASPGLVPFNAMSTRSHRMSYECIHSAATSFTLNSTFIHSFVQFQDSPADGQSITFSMWLRSGTYTLSVLGSTAANRGMLDIYCDAVLQISGQDWYSAVSTFNVIVADTVTVLGDGYHSFTIIVDGKNGSSSGYFYALSAIWIRMASD